MKEFLRKNLWRWIACLLAGFAIGQVCLHYGRSVGYSRGYNDGIADEKQTMMPMAMECVADRIAKIEEEYVKKHPGKHIELHITSKDRDRVVRR